MIKKIIITESQLKLLIKEELGILEGIHDEVLKIYNRIIDDLPKREKIKEDDFIIQKGSVPCSLLGHDFKISYRYRNFQSKEVVDAYGEDNLVTGGSSYLGKYWVICEINLYGVSGVINKQRTVEVIQHELEHIYQEFRTQKTIPNNMFYAKMRTDMESSNENRRKIGRLIYGCLKSEQEGFINGLYSYCMVDNFQTPPDDYSNIKNSEAWKLYSEIVDVYKELQNNSEMLNILKEYKWSIKKIEKHIDNFIKRIGRVLIKVNNDKNLKGWRK